MLESALGQFENDLTCVNWIVVGFSEFATKLVHFGFTLIEAIYWDLKTKQQKFKLCVYVPKRVTSFAKGKNLAGELVFFPSMRVITPHIFFFPNIKWKLDNLSHVWPPLYYFPLSHTHPPTVLIIWAVSFFSHIFHISKQFSIPGQVERPAALCNGTSRWSLIGTDHRASLRDGGEPLAAVCQRGL